MNFKRDFRDLKLNFHFDNMHIKVIDAKHGIFLHSFARHMHSFYELHYIASGHGRLVLDDTEYELEQGQLFLLAPKVHHAQFTDVENPMEEYCFSFEIRYGSSGQSSEISNALTSSDFNICKDTQRIDLAFKELESEINDCGPGYMIAIQLLLTKILLATARNFSGRNNKATVASALPDDRRSLLMDEAFLFSYQNLTLEGLAALLNLSTRHTERLIREKYGTTFVQYRTQSRLNAAVNMMTDTNLKLSEIAEKCGFSSYLHFGKIFQNTFGVSPSVYRKRLTDTIRFAHIHSEKP